MPATAQPSSLPGPTLAELRATLEPTRVAKDRAEALAVLRAISAGKHDARVLLADPAAGTPTWAFALPTMFLDCLAVRLGRRTKTLKKWNAATIPERVYAWEEFGQGADIHFLSGYTLYSNASAYATSELPAGVVRIQLTMATSARRSGVVAAIERRNDCPPRDEELTAIWEAIPEGAWSYAAALRHIANSGQTADESQLDRLVKLGSCTKSQRRETSSPGIASCTRQVGGGGSPTRHHATQYGLVAYLITGDEKYLEDATEFAVNEQDDGQTSA